MTDKILALLAFLTLLGFCGIIVWFVPELDLAIVSVVVVVMAAFDFFRTLFRRGDPSGR